ncbi:uncharacterized protein TNCV_4315881 [Trichonephila clavipes]|nr:uncharacterized protein TNCV_4315881 [Trichonephila clavipes]
MLTCRVHGFMRFSPYPYTSISSNQLETRLVRPSNVFLVIYSSMSVLKGPDEAVSFVSCSQQEYTSGPLAEKAHIDPVSLNGSHEQQERNLLVRLINSTNERRLVQEHETTPLRVKGDIEDVYSELDNGGQRLHFLDQTPRIILL